MTATDCYAAPAPLGMRLVLGAPRGLKSIGVIPFLSYFRKADIRRLVEEAGFSVVETDVLHPAPVNVYLLARKA